MVKLIDSRNRKRIMPEYSLIDLDKYAEQIEIKLRFTACEPDTEFIEVKVKSVTPTDNGMTLEFASQEDANRFREYLDLIPIRMTFI